MTAFDVQLASLQVRSVQFVHGSTREENTKLGDVKQSQTGDLFVTTIEIMTRELGVRGRSSSGPHVTHQSDVAVALGSFTIALLSKAPGRGSYKHETRRMCHLTIGPSFASAIRRNVLLSLGVVSSHIGHAGPDLVFGTVAILARYTWSIVSSQGRRSGFVSNRQVIHGVLMYSHERSVVDPLSTIQPSYLVQHGLPDKLRKDTTFKFLVYLRHCLRLLDDHERHAIYASQPNVSIEEVLEALQNQWFGAVGDDDSSTLSQQSLLQELLHGRRKRDVLSLRAFWESLLDTVSLSIAGIQLTLGHPTDGLESDLIMGPIAITAQQQLADLVQSIAWNPGKSFPNIYSRDRERHSLLRASLCVSLDRISSTVHPQAVEFMQIVLRDYRHHSSHLLALRNSHPLLSPTSPCLPASPPRPLPTLSIDCTLSMRSFTFTAAAEQLIVRFKNSDITYASSFLGDPPSLAHPTWDISTNHSLIFGCATFEACSSTHTTQPKEHVLASASFENGKVNVVLQQDLHRNLTIRVLAGLGKVLIDVPRSVLRLYRFVEGWRADYLPGIDATVRALLAELRSKPKAPSRASSQASRSPKVVTFQIQASVTSARAMLQVMHGTWVSWEVHQTIAFLLNDARRKGGHLFGLQMGPHVFEISRSREISHPAPSLGIRLEFPTVTFRGSYDTTGLHGLALVEFFHITVRPSDWDTLLSVQQKSGQDFNDLIHIIEQTRQKRPAAASPAPTSDNADKKPAFKFNGSLKMKGFRIGLEGLTSRLFLECDDISGGVSNLGHSLWHVRLSDLALSLASQLSIGAPSHRDRRSAFVRVDFDARMGQKAHTSVPHLQVSMTKIHAVMQPSSIGELGDFVDHLQVRRHRDYES